MERRELIHTIAPALRVLSARGATLPLVGFHENAPAPEGALAFTPPQGDGGDDPRAVVAALSRALAESQSPVEALSVPGLGVFTVAPAALTPGRAAGKIAVVTGAAQGFGYEIACALADEGAWVALGDVQEDAVRQAAAGIAERQGRPCALGLVMNVTSARSIADALDAVVRTWGGVDLFVSNAGVLRAGSVKDQPEADFDFVTAVNYKGYFLCVQAAAPIMAVGHMARADYFSDIIQINSKSGLQGSNRNFAYAGGKFGGIGLTQSFAMELVEDGIKVNSICPGNFFDGPLWSDPDNGLFVQYLRAGKVPGATSIADVKAFYEAKVPLGRGCRTGDVMKAIYYLMEQEYETGQAVPVTGGQVMLK